MSINCDEPGSGLLAFEKAGETASELIRLAEKNGVEVKIQTVPGYPVPLEPVRSGLFQGSLRKGCLSGRLHTFQVDSPYRAVVQGSGMLLALRFDQVKIGSRRQSAIVAFASEGLGKGSTYQALAGGAL